MGIAGAHEIVDDDTLLQLQPHLPRKLQVGTDAGRNKQEVAGQHLAVAQRHRRDACARCAVGGMGSGNLRLRPHADTEAFQVGQQEFAATCIELAGQQGRRAFEHSHFQTELVETVGRLQAQQATARNDRRARTLLLDIGANRHRVFGGAQHKGAGHTVAVDGRHEALAARGQDQPIVGQRLTGAQRHRACIAVDVRDVRVEPAGDVEILVPLLGQEVEPLHGRAAVDEPRDPHAVVEMVTLAADEVDLAVRVAAADMVGRSHAGDAVAHDDDTLHALVILEAGYDTRLVDVRLVGRQRHLHVAAHARHAGHARVRGHPQPLKRGALVVAHLGEILHTLEHADRVGATEPHAAAGLDGQVVLLADFQQRAILFDLDFLAIGRHGYYRLCALGGAVAGIAWLALARFDHVDGPVQRNRRQRQFDKRLFFLVGAVDPEERETQYQCAQ